MIERRHEIPKVRDTFPVIDGVFAHMDYELPLTAAQMDTLFFADFGLKSIAPLVMAFKQEGEYLSSENLQVLAAMLLNKYKNKWDRDKEVAQMEYDPIHNYLDEYEEEGEGTEDTTDSNNSSETWEENAGANNSYTRTDNLTEVNEGSYDSTDNGNNAQNRFGLNSATAVPVTSGTDGITSEGSNSNTRTNTGTQSDSDIRDENRTIEDTKDSTRTIDTDKSHSKSGKHSGNIGNISTQKLLLEEIELWKWNLTDEILHDARDFFTLQMYFD